MEIRGLYKQLRFGTGLVNQEKWERESHAKMCAPRPFKVKDWALTCGRFAITLPRMQFSIRSRCVVHYLYNSLVLQMHAILMIQTRGPASDTYMVI